MHGTNSERSILDSEWLVPGWVRPISPSVVHFTFPDVWRRFDDIISRENPSIESIFFIFLQEKICQNFYMKIFSFSRGTFSCNYFFCRPYSASVRGEIVETWSLYSPILVSDMIGWSGQVTTGSLRIGGF